MITIETPRLILRPLAIDDDLDMFEYASDLRVGPAAGWLPHKNIFDTKTILQRMIEGNDVWAIVYKENNKMIGTIGLHKSQFELNVKEKSLGYVLNPRYWGLGLMPEATTFVLRYAFTVLNIEVVRIAHFESNLRSSRVIQKCGFHFDGTIRSVYRNTDGNLENSKIYSLTKNDFYQLGRKT